MKKISDSDSDESSYYKPKRVHYKKQNNKLKERSDSDSDDDSDTRSKLREELKSKIRSSWLKKISDSDSDESSYGKFGKKSQKVSGNNSDKGYDEKSNNKFEERLGNHSDEEAIRLSIKSLDYVVQSDIGPNSLYYSSFDDERSGNMVQSNVDSGST